jgi:hypothetical protein
LRNRKRKRNRADSRKKVASLPALFLFFLFLPPSGSLHSQTLFESFRKLSRPEKVWVFTHPFIAHRAFLITREVLQTTKQVLSDPRLDGNANGGQVDAFRHGYWMARLSTSLPVKKILSLGIAHEKGNRLDFLHHRLEEASLPDSSSSVMDLFNNKQGASIGAARPESSPAEIKELVIREIQDGNFFILETDLEGNFIDCSGKAIMPNEWKGKWGIPKCLGPSNRVKRRSKQGE